MAYPFLKWPGGKRWVAPLLVDIIGDRLKGVYFEPFVGSGAVFFRLQPSQALLSDINRDLVLCLQVARDKPDKLVEAVWRFKNTAECYYKVRGMRPRSEVGAAAKFLYLNRTCWGGIYRLNRRGEFNTPFGDSRRAVCRRRVVLACSQVLRNARLKVGDFADSMAQASGGDVVFCDPPYSLEGSNGFLRYNDKLFRWSDQVRLAEVAHRVSAKGASVIISGPSVESFLNLYGGWHIMKVGHSSNVAREPSRRRVVEEVLLFSWSPKMDVSLAGSVGSLGRGRLRLGHGG